MGGYGVPVTQEPLTDTAQPPAASSRHRKKRIWLAMAIGFVLALTAGGIYLLVRPSSFDVRGTLKLQDPETVKAGCTGQGGYSDLRGQFQVVVTDATGATVGIGRVEKSTSTGLTCDYQFVVRDVPAGRDFYGVEVTHRGKVQYSEAQLRTGVTLSLGSG